ncbi:MAG: BatA domain-containing protein, partial [Phycisphaerae bacterium]|nr:BatA domain-containing protein [Phycisphaerae bacterium]
MSFVSPMIFWIGLGTVAVPIIIHLLNRRRFRIRQWAAMQFLNRSIHVRSTELRLRDFLLLLLRCLAVLLLALAL